MNGNLFFVHFFLLFEKKIVSLQKVKQLNFLKNERE